MSNFQEFARIVKQRFDQMSQQHTAMKTLNDLGIEDCVERRHAVAEDISAEDIIYFSEATSSLLKGGVSDLLMQEAVKNVTDKGVDGSSISIEEFIKDIVPNCKEMEVKLDHQHKNKLVSLVSPVNLGEVITKWSNGFSWSYNGDFTDSVTERVKKAGGSVDARLRVTLSWFNTDDLDIHASTPSGGEIYYGNRRGILDVDMNCRSTELSNEAVENLAFNNPQVGNYEVWVENYAQRNTTDVGFNIQVALDGTVKNYSFKSIVPNKKRVSCLGVSVLKDNSIIVAINNNLSEDLSGEQVWGIQTGQYHKVNMLMLSPNHWAGNTQGNKHYMFMLDKCISEEPARGIYNEFLRDDLHASRKVFEVLGSKMKCKESKNQLSGLGFSSTVRQSVSAKCDGRTYKVEI